MRQIVRAIRDSRARRIAAAVRNEKLTYLEDSALQDLYGVIADLEARSMPGILIEAGCALGGGAIVMASAKSKARPFYIYDVFDMIPPPSDEDGDDVHKRYQEILSGQSKGIGGTEYYGYRKDLIDEVRKNFVKFKVPADKHNVHFVKGLFEDTLDVTEPVLMAHIDCDWYASVMTCLSRIVPRLVMGGVLVIDDYDAWSGCRKAVDEYFSGRKAEFAFVTRSRLHIVRIGSSPDAR